LTDLAGYWIRTGLFTCFIFSGGNGKLICKHNAKSESGVKV